MRVGQIIPHIKGVLGKMAPKPALFTDVIKTGGKYSSRCGRIKAFAYGIFIDSLIQYMFQNPNWRNRTDMLFDSIKKEYDPTSKRKLTKNDHDFHNKIYKMMVEHFENKNPRFQEEIVSTETGIIGHPDVITNDCVYDVKTTGAFNKLRSHLIYQLLCYSQISRITKIGVILPIQMKIIVVDISDWDPTPFWNVVVGIKDAKRNLITNQSLLEHVQYENYIFSHFRNTKSLYKSLVEYGRRVGQFYIESKKFELIVNKKQKDDFLLARKYIKANDCRMYIHAPHLLNISHDHVDVIDNLVAYLKWATIIGCRGVVIHCGQMGSRTHREAYDNMLNNMNKIIDLVKDVPNCATLFLETSAGEKGELLSHPEELILFYNELEDPTHLVKICVDTCHVFSAGYMPMDFIERLVENNVPIDLIHYNNSLYPIGCCHDRHCRITSGFIQLDELNQVACWAISMGVDLINE